jgi:SAM-dependent methyltransferase
MERECGSSSGSFRGHTGGVKEDPLFHENDFLWDDLWEEVSERMDLVDVVSDEEKCRMEEGSADAWEKHFRQRGSKFFPLKAYLFKEFVELDGRREPEKGVKVVLEAGCGVGSALFPLAMRNPDWKFHAFDFCEEAVKLCKESEYYDSTRMNVFQWDLASKEEETSPEDAMRAISSCDYAIASFVLSALPIGSFMSSIRKIAACLKPGGKLFVRDYGVGDARHVKMEKGESDAQRLSHYAFVRGDGTLCQFFERVSFSSWMEKDGLFQTEEVDYKTVRMQNRKQKRVIDRVYFHGIFAKV